MHLCYILINASISFSWAIDVKEKLANKCLYIYIYVYLTIDSETKKLDFDTEKTLSLDKIQRFTENRSFSLPYKY